MPKETFFNLPETKQKRILEAAIDEFAANGYEISRVNEIVRRSSIPKVASTSTSKTSLICSDMFWTLSTRKRWRL
ncbi:hypothetical protein BG32_08980 [Mesotoga sp. HF07.pep.5.2.highcov]|nr:hypothetical protein BG32_08980 [Mesotoga sp. HF07.pep.5.2.highcov]